MPPIPAHSGWRGALPRPAGRLAGSLLVIAARPIRPSITDKDTAPYDPLLVGGALTILLSVAAASLAAVLTTRYPAGVPARTPMDSGALRPGRRQDRRRHGLPGRRTHLLQRDATVHGWCEGHIQGEDECPGCDFRGGLPKNTRRG
ncbi:hypothetical protein GCM10010305_18660 [Streptomyces termitum]|uniref:Uncharacterized protein n=1 Tax=Streptomyces termitum TaxID=67368 RepID=A0A918SWZ8_9ACTN|nr:hypothetical protein GCM10010305_18660 [Streptomyces termitum]